MNSIVEDSYTKLQIVEVNALRQQLSGGSATVTIVDPPKDYNQDRRRFLGVLGFMPENVAVAIQEIQESLKKIDPSQFYIPPSGLHLTLKNIRTIAEPPNFNEDDVSKVLNVLPKVAAAYQPLPMIGKGLLVMPTSVSIPVYSIQSFGDFISQLDREFSSVGVPDNKQYSSQTVFFTNVTLVRFLNVPSPDYFAELDKMLELELPRFELSSVELISSNLAFTEGQVFRFGSFELSHK